MVGGIRGVLGVLVFSALLLVAGGCAQTNRAPGSVSPSATDRSAAHETLRGQLLALRERDQAARRRWIELMQGAERNASGGVTMSGEAMEAMQAVRAIDAESTAFLQEVVAAYGWPTRSMVGDDGASAAWILAQHADQDPAFQAEVLALMEPLVAIEEVKASDFALLTDRVRLAQGLPQVYATQFTNDAEGFLRPAPTEDWGGVEARRASVGLPPLEEYARALARSYGDELLLKPMPFGGDH